MTGVSIIVTADSKENPGIGHVRLESAVTLGWNTHLRHIDQAGINDLAAFGYKTGIPELLIKGIEQLLHQTMLCQLLTEEPQGLGIRHGIIRTVSSGFNPRNR